MAINYEMRLLKWIHPHGAEFHELHKKLILELHADPNVDNSELREEDARVAIWRLISRGLVVLNTDYQSHYNWTVFPSSSGRALLDGLTQDPEDPLGYLEGVRRAVPDLSSDVVGYLREAAMAYSHALYTAAAVMTGVAMEAAVKDVTAPFVRWLKLHLPKARLIKSHEEERTSYESKLADFRKALEEVRTQLPHPIDKSLDIQLGASADIIRLTRNDAGHPNGVTIPRADCMNVLLIASTALTHLYGLKRFCYQSAASSE